MKSLVSIVNGLHDGLKIRCHLCNKPVDRHSVEGGFHFIGLEIRAYCHDDVDVMRVSMEQLEDIPGLLEQMSAQSGVAFAPKIVVSGDADYQTEQQLIRGN